nr:Dihydrofolate reductase [uncultured bacterium]
MILSSIAAMAKNRVIGKDNKLPWSIPEDMKFFREKTKGHVMIMGRKTFESLEKPLPNRFHIVITRNQSYDYHDPMVEVVSGMPQALELSHMLLKKFSQRFGDEVFIIGGAEIYKQSMDLINRLYLTVIEKDFEGDAYFPEFDEKELKLVKKEDRSEPIPFSFRVYER